LVLAFVSTSSSGRPKPSILAAVPSIGAPLWAAAIAFGHSSGFGIRSSRVAIRVASQRRGCAVHTPGVRTKKKTNVGASVDRGRARNPARFRGRETVRRSDERRYGLQQRLTRPQSDGLGAESSRKVGLTAGLAGQVAPAGARLEDSPVGGDGGRG
jgi:hypothetical protein